MAIVMEDVSEWDVYGKICRKDIEPFGLGTDLAVPDLRPMIELQLLEEMRPIYLKALKDSE